MWKWQLAQAAEIRWWQRYLRGKDPAQYLSWKKNYWLDFIRRFGVQISPDWECLDAGSSLAGIFTVLDNPKVVATDPLMNAYAEKLPQFFRQADYPNVEFRQERLEMLQEQQRFGLVCCLNVINHVENLPLCVGKLWAAVKKGGMLLISVDAHRYKGLKYLFRAVPADILHPQQHDIDDYSRLFAQICGQEIAPPQLIKQERIFGYWLYQIPKL